MVNHIYLWCIHQEICSIPTDVGKAIKRSSCIKLGRLQQLYGILKVELEEADRSLEKVDEAIGRAFSELIEDGALFVDSFFP